MSVCVLSVRVRYSFFGSLSRVNQAAIPFMFGPTNKVLFAPSTFIVSFVGIERDGIGDALAWLGGRFIINRFARSLSDI